ncbi:MAG: hypothetical protein KDN22_30035 [Verrucomicrobiae bacterium]|nr:hypothetical protein [Verrucomicrobiae bacterium]
MRARFHSADPYSGSNLQLNALLRSGADQLAISCAYCTAAGVEFLKPHASRLNNRDSFVVVSWDKPTDFAALEELHKLIPGHLYVHFGNTTPVERKVGHSKMHSKAFYARSGGSCSLWTGSHNLTASAILGANCEAAILLEGDADEDPFIEALAHLEQCRDEAHLYYSGMQGPEAIDRNKEPTLIIHAEGPAATPPPWHLYLRAQGTEIDSLLTLPSDLRLYLYPPGSLSRGWQLAHPHSAYGGSLTGVNLTPNHPSFSGAQASWPAATHVVDIEFSGSAPTFGIPSPDPRNVTTQALFSITGAADLQELWLKKKPTPKLEPIQGTESRRYVDQEPVSTELLSFFTNASKGFSGELIFKPIAGFEPVLELSGENFREEDLSRAEQRLGVSLKRRGQERDISDERVDKAPFIFRAYYRL